MSNSSKIILPVSGITEIQTQIYLTVKASRSSVGKGSDCNVGDLGSIPGLGRRPGGGKGYPLQYSALEHSMNCKVYEVTKSRDTTE